MQNNVLYRQLSKVSVTSSDGLLIAANPRRVALIVSSPAPIGDGSVPNNQKAGAVSTATTGAKLSYTVPAGKYANVLTASFYETTGTTVVAKLEATIGGTTLGFQDFTRQGYINTNLLLAAGDSVDWNVATAVAASVSDFAIYVVEHEITARVTISLDGTAVLDKGININPGGPPFIFMYDEFGQAIREDIRAISDRNTVTVTVLDIFEVGCPCLAREG